MSDLTVKIPTPHGEVELPFAQIYRMADAIQDIRARGGDPVWHFNDCGECVSVHGRAGGGGWVIDRDGGADWHEGPEEEER